MVHGTTTAGRVLLVTKGLDIGGIERVVTDLATGLARSGRSVEVAVVNSDRDRLVATIERADVPVHRLDGTDRIGLGAANRLRRLIDDGEYHVVHIHGPLLASLVRVTNPRATIVTTAHTPWSSLHRLTRAGWRCTARRDAATIAVSDEVAASLPDTGRATTIIPHGVDEKRVAEARTRSGDPERDTACRLVTVASHRSAKNYPNLLNAIRQATDRGASIRLSAIGEGEALAEHVALAERLGIADLVDFEPPSEDVLERIAAADVLVVASDYEGQPIVVAEALALGKPVVATDVGRVGEMVDESFGRVVPPRDTAALAAALAELADSPRLRAELTSVASAAPIAWTLDDVLAAHIEVYDRVGER